NKPVSRPATIATMPIISAVWRGRQGDTPIMGQGTICGPLPATPQRADPRRQGSSPDTLQQALRSFLKRCDEALFV
ncbi:hypothetical protein, partial [Parachitinimonas caeni]